MESAVGGAFFVLGFSSSRAVNWLTLTTPVALGSSVRISSLNSESLNFTTMQFRTCRSSSPVIRPSGLLWMTCNTFLSDTQRSWASRSSFAATLSARG